MPPALSHHQQVIYEVLALQLGRFPHTPRLDVLCDALGLRSRRSLRKQIQSVRVGQMRRYH
jgi:repressor LexA